MFSAGVFVFFFSKKRQRSAGDWRFSKVGEKVGEKNVISFFVGRKEESWCLETKMLYEKRPLDLRLRTNVLICRFIGHDPQDMICQPQDIVDPKFCYKFLGTVFPEMVSDQIGGFVGLNQHLI